MAIIKPPSYYQLPKTGDPTHPVFRRTRVHTVELADEDQLQFLRFPMQEPWKLINAGAAWGDGDTDGSPSLAGTLRVSDGTNHYNLLTGLALGAPGFKDAVVAAAAAAALPTWVTGVFPARLWVLELLVTAAPTAGQAADYYAWAEYTTDLEDGEINASFS